MAKEFTLFIKFFSLSLILFLFTSNSYQSRIYRQIYINNFDRHTRSISSDYMKWLSPSQSDYLHNMIKNKVEDEKIWREMISLYQETEGKQRHTALENLNRLCKIANSEESNDSSKKRKRNVDESGFTFKSYVKSNPENAKPLCLEVMTLYNEIKDNSLTDEQMLWLSPSQKLEIKKIRDEGGDHWDIMSKLAEYIVSLSTRRRKEVSEMFKPFCVNQLSRLLGPEGFETLKNKYESTSTADEIVETFKSIIETLETEYQRNEAEHYGLFCKKVFHIIRYDPDSLLTWLTASQKQELISLMKNPNVGDLELYNKIIEFYEISEEEAKEDAKRIITLGCKSFIERMLGNDVLDEIEYKKKNNTHPQILASKLVRYASEIIDENERDIARKSLPICKKIYLGFNNECECNGNSDSCDSETHKCLNCQHNTYGVQCSRCLNGFHGTAINGDCHENEVPNCNCNGHALSGCDYHGNCLECLNHTVGVNCERCASGYYGDPLQGTSEDCVKCPCPGNIDCFINEHHLVQCKYCPKGLSGITCEINESTHSSNSEIKETGKAILTNM
ncbi:EGF-like, laminin domain-containing protein [Strongyloides ratti]|uniref:EGF-like, laminin domain-containing protein n=1 Tax=Strongyloides ratti TaxID=34506 RepID=A0A090L0N4_STRRB|nr:EGF-like, laminin domain-containing protein [Strongyloides ratti]CEF63335.1 EGF-like, laminin domain-containing protein [Strongyloides ratti]